jgi:hypothetical protein
VITISVLKYKDLDTGEWLLAPVLKVVNVEGGSGGGTAVFPHGEIPSYVKDEAFAVAEKVKSVQTANTVTFLAMSDSHQAANSNVITGNVHAGMAAKILAYALNLDFCTFLGDYSEGSSTTTLDEGRSHFEAINMDISEAFAGVPNFRTVGNHDPLGYSTAQTGSYLSNAELYGYIGSYNNDGTTVMGSTELGYCYRDFAAKKLRVVCLNTADETNLSGGAEGVSAAQQAWLCSTLRDTPSGYKIILLSHHPLDWGEVAAAANIVYQYSIKGSYTVNGTSYSFASAKAEIACAIHGHVHGFRVDNLHYILGGTGYPSTVKRIATPNMCYNRNNEYGENGKTEYFGIEFGEATTYDKTAGTAKDTAFVVNVYDPDANYLYSFCYGAGYDRRVYLGEEAIPATGITLPTSSGNVDTGGSLTLRATVTPSNTTESVTWKSSNTSIATVTPSGDGLSCTIKGVASGNATITATIGSYSATYALTVNKEVITIGGYTDGYRLSTSTGELKAYAGKFVTDYIDIRKTTWPNGCVIKITGVDMAYNSASSQYKEASYCVYSNNTGTFVQANYLPAVGTSETIESAAGTGAVAIDASGNMTFTITEPAASRYIRFCGTGSGANATMTIESL